jgi:uncharacterized protein (DUF1778 family)
MIFIDEHRVRLTPDELNLVRQAAALNGSAVNAVRTRDELLQACLDGLPLETQAALLQFLEQANWDDARA